jgi:hypothetical protein
MNNDEVIWQVINHHHCSFKAKTKTQNFCRRARSSSSLVGQGAGPVSKRQGPATAIGHSCSGAPPLLARTRGLCVCPAPLHLTP